MDYNENIKDGLDWLLHSGIQDTTDKNVIGGFSAWYDVDEKRNSFIYSEITGYALNLLLSLKTEYPSTDIENRIALAAHYLTEIAFDSEFGVCKCRFDENGWLKNYCTFDNIIIANSLINHYKIYKDDKSLETAKIILDTLMTKLFYGDGLYARYITSEHRYQNDAIKWSTCFGSFHAKSAIPFLNYYDISNEKKYLDFANLLLKLTSAYQELSGRFITCNNSNSTFVHPQCYTLEGFIVGGIYLNNEIYLEIAKKTMKWMDSILMENGGIPGHIHPNEIIKMDSPDINAQFLRSAVLLNYYNQDKSILNKIAKRIISYQELDSSDKKKHGGFKIGDVWFYDQINSKMGLKRNHINTWATIFALNALYYFQFKDRCVFSLC